MAFFRDPATPGRVSFHFVLIAAIIGLERVS
jgi:hypothetical protein